MNLQRFIFHFFSIPILLGTLFIPFHRLAERRERGFNPENILETLIVNTVMRAVGALVRGVIILTGLVVEILAFGLGLLFFGVAFLLPIALPLGFILGVLLLIG